MNIDDIQNIDPTKYHFQYSFNADIMNCTMHIKFNLKGIFALCKVYLRNYPSVKLRRLIINLIFNRPKHHSSRFAGANCSFANIHKTIVEIHPQKTKNNGLSALYLVSTTSLITVSLVEPSRLQRKLQEQR